MCVCSLFPALSLLGPNSVFPTSSSPRDRRTPQPPTLEAWESLYRRRSLSPPRHDRSSPAVTDAGNVSHRTVSFQPRGQLAAQVWPFLLSSQYPPSPPPPTHTPSSTYCESPSHNAGCKPTSSLTSHRPGLSFLFCSVGIVRAFTCGAYSVYKTVIHNSPPSTWSLLTPGPGCSPLPAFPTWTSPCLGLPSPEAPLCAASAQTLSPVRLSRVSVSVALLMGWLQLLGKTQGSSQRG